ncbi:MAG: hypothetical protein VX413_06540, partial [Verrucomicrobiota bacterium]|nr:hypothetical protein [Verrucomicrobiota bacterium]
MSSTTANETAPGPIEAFAPVEQAGGPLLPLRKAGLARFAEWGFPTTRDEDWRFTNLKPLVDLPFLPTLEPVGQALDQTEIGGITFGQHDIDRLVFLDGHFLSNLSLISDQPDGVTISNLTGNLSKLENN